ncbi:hypothetical protein SKAU_G00268700 [Synaphobranchus kaupii]|uniref:C2 NT-type domain-containing protein n=1 Tax=Synaphobranchus kaupii TaxID=118154 RepID=A0A9Q1F052_SYNKA|nr:hypothetical protein SKAU_G00268700 [Synaphobranchus kaupii]
MTSVWKRLQRVGKKATKFQFVASYQELIVECTKKWQPDKLRVVWTRRNRRICSKLHGWQPGIKNPYRGMVVWPVPENVDITVTLFKDPHADMFEDKDWTFVIENETKGHRKVLASVDVNMKKFASATPTQTDLTLKLKPLSVKVVEATLKLSLSCVFLREGKATDEDMQSLASLMSVKPTDIGNLDDFNESDDEEDKRACAGAKLVAAAPLAPLRRVRDEECKPAVVPPPPKESSLLHYQCEREVWLCCPALHITHPQNTCTGPSAQQQVRPPPYAPTVPTLTRAHPPALPKIFQSTAGSVPLSLGRRFSGEQSGPWPDSDPPAGSVAPAFPQPRADASALPRTVTASAFLPAPPPSPQTGAFRLPRPSPLHPPLTQGCPSRPKTAPATLPKSSFAPTLPAGPYSAPQTGVKSAEAWAPPPVHSTATPRTLTFGQLDEAQRSHRSAGGISIANQLPPPTTERPPLVKPIPTFTPGTNQRTAGPGTGRGLEPLKSAIGLESTAALPSFPRATSVLVSPPREPAESEEIEVEEKLMEAVPPPWPFSSPELPEAMRTLTQEPPVRINQPFVAEKLPPAEADHDLEEAATSSHAKQKIAPAPELHLPPPPPYETPFAAAPLAEPEPDFDEMINENVSKKAKENVQETVNKNIQESANENVPETEVPASATLGYWDECPCRSSPEPRLVVAGDRADSVGVPQRPPSPQLCPSEPRVPPRPDRESPTFPEWPTLYITDIAEEDEEEWEAREAQLQKEALAQAANPLCERQEAAPVESWEKPAERGSDRGPCRSSPEPRLVVAGDRADSVGVPQQPPSPQLCPSEPRVPPRPDRESPTFPEWPTLYITDIAEEDEEEWEAREAQLQKEALAQAANPLCERQEAAPVESWEKPAERGSDRG